MGFFVEYPLAAANWLQVIHYWVIPPQQLIVVLPENTEMNLETRRKIIKVLPYPGQLIIGSRTEFAEIDLTLFREKKILNNQITYYLCKNHTCSLPTNSLEEILSTLGKATH